MTSLTLAAALERARSLLRQAGIDDAPLSAEILLAHVLGVTRTSLRTWPERPVDGDILRMFDDGIARRARGEPIAYITGRREFWSLDLRVTTTTLIPRAETERIVELALDQFPVDAQRRIADLGTGSGAIALAIARERPGCHVVATDVSRDAVAVAVANAERLGINNVQFRVGDWYAAIAGEMFDVIVSNPPYVAHGDAHLARGDLRFEPALALASGDGGLRDIRQIVAHAGRHLNVGGALMIEHGYDQRSAVADCFRAAGFVNVQTHDDYAGTPRVVAGTKG